MKEAGNIKKTNEKSTINRVFICIHSYLFRLWKINKDTLKNKKKTICLITKEKKK